MVTLAKTKLDLLCIEGKKITENKNGREDKENERQIKKMTMEWRVV